MQKRIIRFNYYTDAPLSALKLFVKGYNNMWLIRDKYPGSKMVLKKRRPILKTDEVVPKHKYKITFLCKPEVNNDTYIKAEMKLLYKACNFAVRASAWQP